MMISRCFFLCRCFRCFKKKRAHYQNKPYDESLINHSLDYFNLNNKTFWQLKNSKFSHSNLLVYKLFVTKYQERHANVSTHFKLMFHSYSHSVKKWFNHGQAKANLKLKLIPEPSNAILNRLMFFVITGFVEAGVLYKMCSSKIQQNSQEKTCVAVTF